MSTDAVHQLAARQDDRVIVGDQQDFLALGRPGADGDVVTARIGAAAREFLHSVGKAGGVQLRLQRGEAAILRRLREGGDALVELCGRGDGRGRDTDRGCARGKGEQQRRQCVTDHASPRSLVTGVSNRFTTCKRYRLSKRFCRYSLADAGNGGTYCRNARRIPGAPRGSQENGG